nr:hypothetical protein [Tanacetum cinerariifolium]
MISGLLAIRIMDTTQAQQKALDDALVAPANRLKIGICNQRLSFTLKSKEHTLQVGMYHMKNVDYVFLLWEDLDTQIYGTILLKNLTNQVMIESEAYKTYYAYATDEKTPKLKYVKKKADSKATLKKKPTQATNGKRLKATAKVAKSRKKKLPAKGLETLSDVALTEAEQMKLITKRSKTDYHISHASCSCADEGTSVSPAVPDVPTYRSEDEQIS